MRVTCRLATFVRDGFRIKRFAEQTGIPRERVSRMLHDAPFHITMEEMATVCRVRETIRPATGRPKR